MKIENMGFDQHGRRVCSLRYRVTPAMVDAIRSLDGVCMVVQRDEYTISLSVSKAYQWSEVEPHLMDVLRKCEAFEITEPEGKIAPGWFAQVWQLVRWVLGR